MAIGRQDYEERKERKIDAYKKRAEKNSLLANQEWSKAREMGNVIPLGQPILVGHHSEGAHRSLLKRIDNAYLKGNEADEKAEYYQDKAESAAKNNSINGDDTEALNRYRQKLERLETAHEHMKAIKRAWKKGKNALYELGLTDTDIEELKSKIPGYENNPIPTFALINNNAEIRRVKQKLEELNKLDKMEADNIKFSGGVMCINIEINRIQFVFDDIPTEEIRKHLKSHGFKWAPSEKAWQRQRTLNAVNAAKRIIKNCFSG